jgi:phytoene dehydrogenase-like protein
MTRVLVVGAGHNGLVAAIHLASRGLDARVARRVGDGKRLRP